MSCTAPPRAAHRQQRFFTALNSRTRAALDSVCFCSHPSAKPGWRQPQGTVSHNSGFSLRPTSLSPLPQGE